MILFIILVTLKNKIDGPTKFLNIRSISDNNESYNIYIYI